MAFLSVLALTLFHSCESTKEDQEIAVSAVSVSQPTAEMEIGETIKLIATVTPSNATDKTVNWASSKQSVATVNQDGVVTAVSDGTSTITASCGGKSASCVVTVAKKVIEVTDIELNKTELTLVEGESEVLTATVKPSDATDKSLTWYSSDKSIATVEDGKVTANKAGEATITVKAGAIEKACKVTVSAKVIPVESIGLDHETLTLVEGNTATLVATVTPDNATDKTVTWTSQKPEIATVYDAGEVSAKSEGQTIITATAGSKSATCLVTVEKKVIPVESVSLDQTSLTLEEGDTYTLVATVLPENATDKTVSWASTNTNVAVVENGKVVAVHEGAANITATSGNASATCAITVNKKYIAVSDVALNKTELTLVEGESETLTATVYPSDATEKTVTWSSNAPAVATVDNNGKVTAGAEGNAIITASAGNKTAQCRVTVESAYVPATSISLNTNEVNIERGESYQLTATVIPDNATVKAPTWSSSDESIAVVDQNGKVTAVKAGNASIKAKIDDVEAVCQVSVEVSTKSIVLSQTEATVEKGKTLKLTATLTPTDSTFPVTWESNNTSVANVDQTGSITAVSAGTATITAYSGNIQATCMVTVIVPIRSVQLSPAAIELVVGENMDEAIVFDPVDATHGDIVWTSTNNSVAEYRNGKIYGLKNGSAKIKATVDTFEATCSVKVITLVSGISLDISSATLKPTQTVQLTATIHPDDATDKKVIWSSSDESVATVDSNGLVTANKDIKNGEAVITAKSQTGGYTATCKITVSGNASGGHEGTGEENWD